MNFKFLNCMKGEKENQRIYRMLTYGYGDKGLERLGIDSAWTSGLGTELISGGAAASTLGSVLVGGSGVATAGAGRELPYAGDGRRAFPISWISQVN